MEQSFGVNPEISEEEEVYDKLMNAIILGRVNDVVAKAVTAMSLITAHPSFWRVAVAGTLWGANNVYNRRNIEEILLEKEQLEQNDK